MAKQSIRVALDWRRLLGFDQAVSAPDITSTAQLSPKIGPKDARGFAAYGALGAKIGPKVGFKTARRIDTDGNARSTERSA